MNQIETWLDWCLHEKSNVKAKDAAEKIYKIYQDKYPETEKERLWFRTICSVAKLICISKGQSSEGESLVKLIEWCLENEPFKFAQLCINTYKRLNPEDK